MLNGSYSGPEYGSQLLSLLTQLFTYIFTNLHWRTQGGCCRAAAPKRQNWKKHRFCRQEIKGFKLYTLQPPLKLA